MLFKRTKSEEKERRFPGTARALDGHDAVLAVEAMASDIVVVQSSPGFADAVSGDNGVVERGRDAAAAAGRVVGAAATGLRSAAVIDGVSAAAATLGAAAQRHLPCVFHVAYGTDDDVDTDAGLFQLVARDAQEAADFALVARRVAEMSLTPGVCAQDRYRTCHSVQRVLLPESALVDEFLGRSGDTIDTPTPAQQVLFGKARRRVPRTVDIDHPAGTGGIEDAEAHLKALAARRTYFAGHVAAMLDDAFAEFGELTGRRYGRVTGHRVDDADVVVLAQGAVVDELVAVADALRERDRVKVGVINLSATRPFPGAELTKMLAGKRALTVLERSDRPLGDTLPLAAQVRAAIDRAAENGVAGTPVHEGYAVFKAGDRPRVFSGVYSAGGEMPGFPELTAVVRNMTAASPRLTFYVGFGEDPAIRRFPHLQTLQQSLARDYPGRSDVMLPAASDATPSAAGRSMELYTLSSQGGVFAGNLFAQSLFADAGRNVRTFPQGGLEPGVQSATFTMTHADAGVALSARPATVDTVLVTGGKLVEDVSSRKRLAQGGTLVIESNRDAAGTWNTLSRRTARWIRDNSVRVRVIDAARIAAETASQPAFADQLAVWALFGAYAAGEFSAEQVDAVVAGLRARLALVFGEGHYLVNDIAGAVERGAADVADIDTAAYDTETLDAASDGDAPWTVEGAAHWDDTVFDATRFWHSVGYLYDSGQAGWALSDPHLATGVIPARSSAFRDMSPYRLRMPEWLPENCTGCGVCWAQCPDSALPPTAQSVTSLVATAMAQAEGEGVALIQLKRFSDHIVKQAYKLVSGDDMHRYTRMGALAGDAFAQLVDKLGLDDDKRAALETEFAQVRSRLEHVAVARTEAFFTAPHGAAKGSGALVSIALNPLACTGCGVCIDVCPEDALAWAAQTPDRLAAARAHWDFQRRLPAVPAEAIDGIVSDERPETYVHRLLDRDAYHSLVGGDGSYPGNSAKTAVHLVAAAVESVMKPRVDAHVARLDELIERLQRKIQGDVTEALRINDFDDFARRLDHIGKKSLTPDALASVFDDGRDGLDPERLRRLTRVLDALEEQKQLYTAGSDGHGRARMAMAIDSHGLRLWSGTYPYNPLPYPWACHVDGGALEMAGGISHGIARQVTRELAVCHRADLELADAYDPSVHDEFFAAFGADELSDDERALIPPVVVLSETRDAGGANRDDVSAVLGGHAPIMIVWVDPVGASLDMNTEDAGAATEWALLSLARSHPDALVVQSSVGYPGHLMRRVADAARRGGPSLFHVMAPDPIACGVAPEKTAAQARAAVDARVTPLFAATGGRVDTSDNPGAADEWATRTMTFKEPSGVESSLDTAMTVADWAVHEARFREHFTIVPMGQMSEQMKPLSEYVAMDANARDGVEPFVHFVARGARHVLAVVGPAVVRATEARRDFWRALRSGGEAHANAPQPVASDAQAPVAAPQPAAAPAVDASAHQVLTEQLLRLSGFSADPDFFKQSLREFVVQRNVESRGDGAGE